MKIQRIFINRRFLNRCAKHKVFILLDLGLGYGINLRAGIKIGISNGFKWFDRLGKGKEP